MTDPRTAALFSGPARFVPQTTWGPWRAVVATAFVIVLPLIAFFVAIAALSAGAADDAAIDRKTAAMGSLASPEGVALAAGTQVLSLALLWGFASRGGNAADALLLSPPGPGVLTYALGGLILVAGTGALEYIMYTATKMDIFADVGWLREGLASPYWWGTVLIAAILAPLWEELTFRGFLLSALAQSPSGFWGGALLSNSIWTLLHWGYSAPGMISVFAAGLIFTWLVWRTGSIKTAIVAHAIGNAGALAFAYAFAPSLFAA